MARGSARTNFRRAEKNLRKALGVLQGLGYYAAAIYISQQRAVLRVGSPDLLAKLSLSDVSHLTTHAGPEVQVQETSLFANLTIATMLRMKTKELRRLVARMVMVYQHAGKYRWY